MGFSSSSNNHITCKNSTHKGDKKKEIIQEADELEFYVARRLGATTWSLPGPMTAQIDEARRRSCVQREPFAVNSIQDLSSLESIALLFKIQMERQKEMEDYNSKHKKKQNSKEEQADS
nr:protein ecdysoneless homolog [Ipomoea batatas]